MTIIEKLLSVQHCNTTRLLSDSVQTVNFPTRHQRNNFSNSAVQFFTQSCPEKFTSRCRRRQRLQPGINTLSVVTRDKREETRRNKVKQNLTVAVIVGGGDGVKMMHFSIFRDFSSSFGAFSPFSTNGCRLSQRETCAVYFFFRELFRV